MGLTIHYSLKSNGKERFVRAKLEKLRQIALDLPFSMVSDMIDLQGDQADFNKLGDDDPNRWMLIQASQSVTDPLDERFSYSLAPSHVIAFETVPGDGSEPANFGLCLYPKTMEVGDIRTRTIPTGLKGWTWRSFCKTQYANDPACGGVKNFLKCHLLVIRMIDEAKKLKLLADASDEGNFLEKRDLEALVKEIGEWDAMIAGFAGGLKDALGGDVQTAMDGRQDFEHLEAAGQAEHGERNEKLVGLIKSVHAVLPCPRCHGEGRVVDPEDDGSSEDGKMPCPHCEGDGK
jgi:hypothetical protein